MDLHWIIGSVTAGSQGEMTDSPRRKLNCSCSASGFHIRIDFMLGDRKDFAKPADRTDQSSEHTSQTNDDAGDESSSQKHNPHCGHHWPGGRNWKFHAFLCFVLMLF